MNTADELLSNTETLKRVEMLQEHLTATTTLLREHGLLLDLPRQTLWHCIGAQDPVPIFEEQIRRYKESGNSAQVLKNKLIKIQDLGQLSEGAESAMRLLLEAADAYLEDNGAPRDMGAFVDAMMMLLDMTDAMNKLIEVERNRGAAANKDWNPSWVTDGLKQLLQKHGIPPDNIDTTPIKFGYVVPFENCLIKLHEIAAQQAAPILANKVAGLRLPAEIVDHIRGIILENMRLRRSQLKRVQLVTKYGPAYEKSIGSNMLASLKRL